MSASHQALTVHVHAPEFSGFTHTIESRFTHFAGSEAGSRTTFGMSAKDLATLVTKFSDEYYENEAKILRANPRLPTAPNELKVKLDTFVTAIKGLAQQHKDNKIYQHNSTMVNALKTTGHIPLILSKACAAAQYGRSTRSLNSTDLEDYYGKYPFAQTQAVEYLVKQEMMQKVAELYREISAFRNTLPTGQPDYIACTRLMTAVNEKIIKINEATLPAEYVQFDLYHTFIQKLIELTCQINPQLIDQATIDSIMRMITFVKSGESTVENQKAVSENLYKVLQHFFESKGVGIVEDLKITDALDAVLQEILPIAAYLNSQFNPFSQDSVFGTVVTSKFHDEALKAYRAHESKHTVSPYPPEKDRDERYQYKYKPTVRTEEFSADQIEKILLGEIEAAPQAAPSTASSFLSSMSSFWQRVTDGNAVATVATSESRRRREQAALPAPAVQLLLMPSDSQAPAQQQNRPGM
jgi:hypothetical protein